MNNKGMTLVELIITFSLLMIIIVGMFNLILNMKIDLDNEQIAKEISEYSNFLNSDIHYDLITKKPIAIVIKTTSTDSWNIKLNTNYTHNSGTNVTGNTFKINSTVAGEAINIKGEKDISNVCSSYYPCAVYAYYDPLKVSNGTAVAIFKAIAINTAVDENNKFGVKFNNVFEEIPHYDHIDLTQTVISMTFKDNFFIIDYPIYIAKDITNYGFKIAYPM